MTPNDITKEVRTRFNESAHEFSKNPSSINWETLLRCMMAWQQWQVIKKTSQYEPAEFAKAVRLINLQDEITQTTLGMDMDDALELFAYQKHEQNQEQQ